MSTTAVPISIRLVLAPIAASSGNGEDNWRAKWCTLKYAPSAPSSSATTESSMDCRRASDADRVCEDGDGVQWPNDRKPIFFMTHPTTEKGWIHWLPRSASSASTQTVVRAIGQRD